jgi:prepilin-type N-terminal cleavage/methylation domain-containing protein
MKNKGFTLIEVLVSSVIISILLVSLVTAFAAVRKVNTVSAKQDTAISLSTTLLEKLKASSYDEITGDTYMSLLNIGTLGSFKYTGDVDSKTSEPINWGSYSDDTSTKHIVLDNIESDLAYYKVYIDITPSDDNNYNTYNFPELGDIASSSAVIIDTKTMTASYLINDDGSYQQNDDWSYSAEYDTSYDNLVLQDLKDRNNDYLNKLYSEVCKSLDKQKEEYMIEHGIIDDGTEKGKTSLKEVEAMFKYPEFGVDAPFILKTDDELKEMVTRTMTIYTGTYNNGYKQLDCKLEYTLDEGLEDIFGDDYLDVEDTNLKYEIYSSKYLSDLTDLYIIYEDTIFAKSESQRNIIKLTNGNSPETSLSYNLYFMIEDDYNKSTINNYRVYINNLWKNPVHNTSLSNLSFTYSQGSPTNTLVSIYTNYDLFYTAGTAILDQTINRGSSYQQADAYTRLYDITLTVEDSDGANLYSTTQTSILK